MKIEDFRVELESRGLSRDFNSALRDESSQIDSESLSESIILLVLLLASAFTALTFKAEPADFCFDPLSELSVEDDAIRAFRVLRGRRGPDSLSLLLSSSTRDTLLIVTAFTGVVDRFLSSLTTNAFVGDLFSVLMSLSKESRDELRRDRFRSDGGLANSANFTSVTRLLPTLTSFPESQEELRRDWRRSILSVLFGRFLDFFVSGDPRPSRLRFLLLSMMSAAFCDAKQF